MPRKRPPTQNEKLTAAAERYFAAWPQEGAYILARHERDRTRLPALLDLPDVDAMRALRKDAIAIANVPADRQLALERALRWLDVDRGNFGGPLGAALTEPLPCPIATDAELDELLAETPGQLQARPPVAIALLPGDDRPFAAFVLTSAAYYIVGPHIFVDSPAAASFRAVVAELAQSDAASPTVRALYHTFARDFWSWLRDTQSPLSSADAQAPARQRKPLDNVLFYDKEATSFPTSAEPIAFGTSRALSSKRGFRNQDGVFYLDETVSGLRFSFNEFTDGTKPEIGTLTLIEDLNWLDPQTAICHEAIIGKWLKAKRSGTLRSSGAVAIHVDEILALRGVAKAKHGGYKVEQKREIAKRLMRIESMLAHGTYLDPQGKKHHLRGRLVDLTVDSEEDLLGNEIPYEFLAKPGDAAWDFYASSEYLADYYLALARLDTRQGVGRMAYLIGRYLMHQYRIRETHNNFEQPFTVSTICDKANVEIEAKPNNQPRFNEYFEEALNKLRSVGIIQQWQYAEGDEEKLPERGRGWFRRWLDNRVRIDPPDAVRERAAIRGAQRQLHLAASKSDGSRIRRKG